MFNKPDTGSASIRAKISLFILIVVGTIFPLAGFTQKALTQSTALPMEIALRDNVVFFLVVPDSDVTRSAYGGKLKLYDAHVAKMFEVTQYLCKAKRDQLSGGYTWI